MKKFVLNYLSRESAKSERVTGTRLDIGGADLMIDLKTGKSVAVYVINRALRLMEIEENYTRNSARNVYSLFLIDGRMMPPDCSEIDPPVWMAALHTVADNRVYAYWCDGQDVTIRPVHMEWKWGNRPRSVTYGPEADITALRTFRVEAASKYLSGFFATVDFGEGEFWKMRDPGAGHQFRYSWRQWSQPDPKRDEQERRSWNAWDEFARHYGSAGENKTYRNYANQRRRRQSQGRSAYERGAAHIKHYSTLGVSVTATYDEVKQAYRRKAREFHPDLHPEEKDKYTAKMADINAAFDAISREKK